MPNKIRIAILGGGMSSLAAAYYLTNSPALRDRFELTIYQQGWRLGGKCASGRDRERGHRIEEHGLHVWMGFYHRAFQMISACYDEYRQLRPSSAFRSWKDAFTKGESVILAERAENDVDWKEWPVPCPLDDADPSEDGDWPSARQLLSRLIRWIADEVRNCSSSAQSAYLDTLATKLQSYSIQQVAAFTTSLAKNSALDPSNASLLGDLAPGNPADVPNVRVVGAELARAMLARDGEDDSSDDTIQASTDAVGLTRDWLRNVAWHAADDTLRRARIMLELAIATAIGIVRARIAWTGDFESQNHLDFTEWLATQGCDSDALYSPPLRAVYDLIFSGPQKFGAKPRHSVAAGSGLRRILLMTLGYKGALYYRMNAGMGDTVVTPLYEVLKSRGVQFKFFHRVIEVRADDAGHVHSIVMRVQAALRAGTREYLPIYEHNRLWCWPNRPDESQVVIGPHLPNKGQEFELDEDQSMVDKVTLHRSTNFDVVLSGMSVGVLPALCSDLLAKSAVLDAAVNTQSLVATAGIQLWLRPGLSELRSDARPPVLTANTRPFDTWCDMSQTLAHEETPQAHTAAYFCGVLEDAVLNAKDPKEVIVQSVAEWLPQNISWAWPRLPRTRIWDELVTWDNRNGVARLAEQHFSINTAKTSQYVLCSPSNLAARIESHQTGFENFFVAGDWTKTVLNGGFVEAAVRSGEQAAAAIAQAYPVQAQGGNAQAGSARVIRRGGDPFQRGPFRGTGATLYSFTVQTDHEKLQTLFDAAFPFQLREDGVRYAVPLPVFAVNILQVNRLESTNPEDRRHGWVPETDASIWIPVLKFGGGLPALCFYPAYAFVDDASAVTIGRELYGWPKQIAKISIPAPTAPADFSVTTKVVHPYGGDPTAVSQSVIAISHDERKSISGCSKPRSGWSEIWRELYAVSAGTDLSPDLIDMVAKLATPTLIFLKQFMDAEDSFAACYQRMVEAQIAPHGQIAWGRLEGDFMFNLGNYDSHPLGSDFGRLSPGKVSYAFVCTFDLDLPHGKVLPASAALSRQP